MGVTRPWSFLSGRLSGRDLRETRGGRERVSPLPSAPNYIATRRLHAVVHAELLFWAPWGVRFGETGFLGGVT